MRIPTEVVVVVVGTVKMDPVVSKVSCHIFFSSWHKNQEEHKQQRRV